MNSASITSRDKPQTTNLFLLCEQARSQRPYVLRDEFIPTFVSQLLRDKLYPDSDASLGRSALHNKKDHNKKDSEKWTDDSLLEEYSDFEGSFLLPESSLEFVHHVLRFANEAIQAFSIDRMQFWDAIHFEIESPSLELLYLLDAKYRIISISNYLMWLKRPHQIQYISHQFLTFCFSSTQFDSSSSLRERFTTVLSHFFHSLLISAYCNPGGSEDMTSLQNMVFDLLTQLSGKLVSSTTGPLTEVNRHFVLTLMQEVRVPNSVKEKYFSHQLSHILTIGLDSGPFKSFTVDNVIQCQERLAEESSLDNENNNTLLDIMKVFVGKPTHPNSVAHVISKSIRSTPCPNWPSFFFLITEFLHKFQYEAVPLLKEIITILLREGVSSRSEDLVSFGFILARHASLVSPGPKRIFPRYEIWYSEMFSEPYSTAKDVDAFHFLSTVLTRWIPFEPSCFLQVHATYWPYIPKTMECKGMWKKYVELAKVRVAEYIEVEEAMMLEPRPNNPVLHDVEMAIKDYENTRNIPLSVGQMLLFNKKYFMEQFLPMLLQKPRGTVLSDARLRLIEALNKKNIIPKDLYNAYKKLR